jgi:2-amino-4-hydroxy-6-hydroxymethyldihydropteridine diphosphokinase
MERETHRVFLLLGSNIQPEQNIPRAFAYLRRQLTVLQVSSVWQSDAMGSSGPDFLNGAVLIITTLDAVALKEQVIHPLEARLGRVRTAHKNAPRSIDIDIILFDGKLLDPNLWNYAHRAVPVAELLPGYRSDSGEYLKDAALRLARATPISLRKDVAMDPDPIKPVEGGPKPDDAQDN